MRQYCLVLLLSGLLLACQQSQPSSSQSATTRWQDSLSQELGEIARQGAIHGFGVAIVTAEGPVYQQGFGLADVASQRPYTHATLQNIASVSKTLLGIALLKAQELGLLHLDDPINSYLPFTVQNPNFPDSLITIRHLATHTGGIVDTEIYSHHSYILQHAADTAAAAQIPTHEHFLSPAARLSMSAFLEHYLTPTGDWYAYAHYLNLPPGSRYEYSNVGATLAALVLEQASGQPYDTFTQEHILQPLGMTASGWSFEAIDQKAHSTLYFDLHTALPPYALITYPDGGLLTSIEDMSRYLSELVRGYSGQGTLLRPESYAILFSQQLSPSQFLEQDTDNPYDDEYNSGIFMGFTPTGYVGHMGGDPGVSTFLFFDPTAQTGRLLFVNTGLNEEGVSQFYTIWHKLGAYEKRLSAKATSD